MKKKIIASVLTFMMVMSACPSIYAATEHYNDSSKTGDAESWQAYQDNWETLAADYTQVSITPGKDETELNFAWYSEKTDGEATPVVHFGTDQAALEAFEGTSGDVDTSLTGDKAYTYNHVTVTGVQPSTTYYYTVEKNGEQTEPVEYTTQDLESVKILYVGDPQIGASKGQPQGDGELSDEAGAANTAALNDGFAWDRTLDAALAENPDLNFVISAGDQVNKTGQPKEEEYAAYLSADALKTLPVATTIGNHDSLNPDYMYHFNNPNTTEYGTTAAGGDYYYSYGDGLFIVLNTNNYNVAEHKQAIDEAIAAYPDATWRVVTIHQDIYGTGLDHSDTDGMILRTQLTPVFDEADIDVVLQGHDHTYSRSKMLYGDGQTHSSYEFQLNEDGTDYDWDHAYNVESGEAIPLNPEEGDEEGAAAKQAFTEDNQCYTIEDVEGNTVTDPQGILYMTANSASGSKYYELIASQQDYVAARSQNWLPSYSVITMTKDSFEITTYQLTDDGQVEAIDDTFTITKTAGAADESADAQGEETTDAAAEESTDAAADATEETTDAAAEESTDTAADATEETTDAAADDADSTTEDAAGETAPAEEAAE